MHRLGVRNVFESKYENSFCAIKGEAENLRKNKEFKY